MAVYPGMIKSRGVRSSTVIETPNTAVGVANGSMTSKPILSTARNQITASDVQDPQRLVKVLNDIQAGQDAQTQATRSNPLSSPCIVRNLTWAASETKVVHHTLKRAYSEWHPSRQRGIPATLVEVELPSSDFPGVTADKAVVLRNTNGESGFTCNLVIAGD